jgi:malonate-semialdehyde dehydrogenase (acetylating)/methylmalonate-semialdehyde dehydrogenase
MHCGKLTQGVNVELPNFINGQWSRSTASEHLPVTNPATGIAFADVPLSTPAEVDAAVRAGEQSFREWRNVPASDRVQYLFKLKHLLEENLEDLARTITQECGKTLTESRGELRRGIENVETACGIPIMMQGANNEDIARGVDEHLFRQPLGVVAAITPFNFPGMIPLWFLPYAIACGNCFILKPSEKTPTTSIRLFEILNETGLPAGVVQLVHGGKQTVEALLAHPGVQAISFVGSTPVARYIYAQAAANGKRAQCQGGAKNPTIVLPDADLEMTTRIVSDSAFGCAGQRCLATSLVITVGDARRPFTDTICEAAANRRVGNGLDPEVEMGPVISAQSQARIDKAIGEATDEGAKARVDGRGRKAQGHEDGFFVFPTVLDELNPAGRIAGTEVFGPVLGLIHVETLDDAIRLVNNGAHGNMACLFTSSSASARRFRRDTIVGNVGINVGVAAPMAFYPFSGWKESFFGDLHAQGRHAVEFYTQIKVVVERWYPEWERMFK